MHIFFDPQLGGSGFAGPLVALPTTLISKPNWLGTFFKVCEGQEHCLRPELHHIRMLVGQWEGNHPLAEESVDDSLQYFCQTKQWFPHICKNTSFELLRKGIKAFSEAIQLITGHNFLQRHKLWRGWRNLLPCNSQMPRLCGHSSESPWHSGSPRNSPLVNTDCWVPSGN